LFQHSVSRAVVQQSLYFLATRTYIFTAYVFFPPRMSSSVIIWTHISTLFWWILYFVEVPKLPRMHFIPCKIPRCISVTACNFLGHLMCYKDALNLQALRQYAFQQMPRFNHSIHITEDESLNFCWARASLAHLYQGLLSAQAFIIAWNSSPFYCNSSLPKTSVHYGCIWSYRVFYLHV